VSKPSQQTFIHFISVKYVAMYLQVGSSSQAFPIDCL